MRIILKRGIFLRGNYDSAYIWLCQEPGADERAARWRETIHNHQGPGSARMMSDKAVTADREYKRELKAGSRTGDAGCCWRDGDPVI